jgi:hypothetical protein
MTRANIDIMGSELQLRNFTENGYYVLSTNDPNADTQTKIYVSANDLATWRSRQLSLAGEVQLEAERIENLSSLTD